MPVRWGLVRGRLIGTLVAVTTSVGCGSAESGDTTTVDGASGATVAPTTTWAQPMSLIWDVEDVVPTGDPSSFDLHLTNLPVEGSLPPCAVQIEASYDPISSDPAISVRVSTDGTELDPGFPGCVLGDRMVRLHATEPIPLDRRIRVEGTEASRHWYPQPDGTLTRCELPACDPATGQPPEPPGCNAALIEDVRAGDVPRRSGIDVRACEGEWAIVEIDIGASACPATGEPERNPCAGTNIDRGYYHLVGGTWQHLTYDESDGCGQVHQQVPELPTALCENLLALP